MRISLKNLFIIIPLIIFIFEYGHAQVWQLDPASLIDAKAEAIADEGGRLPWAGINPILDPWGVCPILDPPVPPPLDAVHSHVTANALSADKILLVCTALTDTFDFGVGVYATATDEDLTPPPVFVNGDASSVLGIEGLGTRTLVIDWRSTTHPSCLSEFYFARACSEILSDLSASITGIPANTDLKIFYEWEYFLDAVEDHECPGPPECGPQAFEDPEIAGGFINLNFNNQGPIAAFNVNTNGAQTSTGDSVIIINNASGTIPVDIDLYTFAQATIDWSGPPCLGGFCDHAGSEFCGRLTLTIHSPNFVPPYGQNFNNYMLPVSGNSGPNYCYSMGKYEITNAQYSDFLNDAELDGGLTERGSNMLFSSNGQVMTPGGFDMFYPQGLLADSRILYNLLLPLGLRYSVEPGFENHPVVHLTWLGAVKYCNWVTLVRGLSTSERCYTEGADAVDWHPVTITTADWATRDLTDSERLDLVSYYDGFRLPMDNQGTNNGWISNQVDDYNEWYKAAAYDSLFPNVIRTGPGGETVPGNHRFYGFGRDVNSSPDANYIASFDPFDNDDAPVGYFNGSTFLSNGITLTNDTDNPFGFYDLSGNVWEWAQCQALGIPSQRALRTGSFFDLEAITASSYRSSASETDQASSIGMRILQVDCSSYICGDADGSGGVDISDAVYIISYIFGGGPAPIPLASADVDCSGAVDISDAVYLISFIFSGGPAPCAACP